MFKLLLALVAQAAFLQSITPEITDPCSKIECGVLNCPAGFTQQTLPGHCCPYCVNPNIVLERKVKGPQGNFGGEPSSTCAMVWCFPTMCVGPETAPTTTNGQCCPRCD